VAVAEEHKMPRLHPLEQMARLGDLCGSCRSDYGANFHTVP
jgi:hypothetical protein